MSENGQHDDRRFKNFPACQLGRWPTAMRFLKLIGLGLMVICAAGCTKERGNEESRKQELALLDLVEPSGKSGTNIYHHLEHLEELRQRANSMLATNPFLFLGKQHGFSRHSVLPSDSPMRALLGIPSGVIAKISLSFSQDQGHLLICSSATGQWLGQVDVNLKTGLVESIHDTKALAIRNQIEQKLRRIVGTREEALRLFSAKARQNKPSDPERDAAVKKLADALWLPSNLKLDVKMIAPGGSNRGFGCLSVFVFGSWDGIVGIYYPVDDNLLSILNISPPHYRFGGFRFEPHWTNRNIKGLLLDSERIPYPKPQL